MGRSGAADPAPAAPPTRYLRDTSRRVIARNDSPDVGFDASLNPYRGCEHGCVYCLRGDTPVLLADGGQRPIAELHPGDRIYGTRREGRFRRYVITEVLARWKTRKRAWRIELANGTRIVASGDHRFLTCRGWKHVTGARQGRGRRPHLTRNDRLLGLGRLPSPPPVSDAYRRGYLTGMIRGDGHPARHQTSREWYRGMLAGLFERIEGRALKSAVDLRVRAIEPLGIEKLYDITTGTGDFIADGVVSHNCYARPTHEYLGFSAGLDFESRIVVKESAPELLREELAAPRWEPRTLLLSGVTDPYQPVERALELTRRCLEVLAECRHPVAVITKSTLVERDADLLAALAERNAACATISVTTLRDDLHRVMEPRAAAPAARLGAIRTLAAAGVPVNVNVAPVIPGLTEHELPGILEAAAEAGAVAAAFIPLRLPLAVAPLFEGWLDRHFPDRKEKVLNRIRSLRGGRLNDPRFGHRMRGEGPFAEHIRQSFHVHRRRLGLGAGAPPLSADGFRRPVPIGGQRDLFDPAP